MSRRRSAPADIDRAILEVLQGAPVSTATIAASLEMRRSTLAVKLADLEQRGLIGRTGRGHLTRWHRGPGEPRELTLRRGLHAGSVSQVPQTSAWLGLPRDGFTDRMALRFVK
jgi:Mn-dependent DtxR family transcriptional regulator